MLELYSQFSSHVLQMHSLLSTCHVVHIPFCRSCHQFVATFYVSPCFFPLLLCGGEQGSDSLEMSCGFCCFSTSPNPERDHALFIWFVICSATYWIIHLKKTLYQFCAQPISLEVQKEQSTSFWEQTVKCIWEQRFCQLLVAFVGLLLKPAKVLSMA